jgi:hypothetical protein
MYLLQPLQLRDVSARNGSSFLRSFQTSESAQYLFLPINLMSLPAFCAAEAHAQI